MAKSSKDVAKNVKALKSAMGIRGDIKPGDLQMKANSILSNPREAGRVAKKLPPLHTKEGVAFRGLI